MVLVSIFDYLIENHFTAIADMLLVGPLIKVEFASVFSH